MTPLTLNEITKKADITIAFARRMHNDPWPFDGEGENLNLMKKFNLQKRNIIYCKFIKT